MTVAENHATSFVSPNISDIYCGQQKEPAILISTLLLQMHAMTRFCRNLESSTTNAWNAKNAIFSRASHVITHNIWTLDHVKVMHSSCADQSKSSVSTWIRLFCSCCRVVCHFPAVFRLLTQSIHILNLECFYLRRETAAITAYY